MSRVLILVEGATEQAVIQRLVAPYLGLRGIHLYARRLGRPGHKGGIRSFDAILPEILNLMRQEPKSTVTTFFDMYALPKNCPGVEQFNAGNAVKTPATIECGIAEVVKNKLEGSFNPDRFIPYIQMYELEALLLAGPKEMAEAFEKPHLESKFRGIVTTCGGCENINDNPETAPSKRIEKLFNGYKKGSSVNAHAPIIADNIGICRIREQCPHFDGWLKKLESLGTISVT